jgi:hypothetical protein
MTITYSYCVQGTAGNGQTWCVDGKVQVQGDGYFPSVLERAQAEAFEALTHGKAIYGYPGLGCSGPYKIVGMIVSREPSKP